MRKSAKLKNVYHDLEDMCRLNPRETAWLQGFGLLSNHIDKLHDPMQALEARKTAKLKRCYYDLEDMLQTNPSGNVPYTPSIPLLYGLRESLRLLKAEGMENVVARHHRWAGIYLLRPSSCA